MPRPTTGMPGRRYGAWPHSGVAAAEPCSSDAGNYLTTYNHEASIVVSPGEYVQHVQVIGYVGSTGSRLHFEICIGGVTDFQHPCSYLEC